MWSKKIKINAWVYWTNSNLQVIICRQKMHIGLIFNVGTIIICHDKKFNIL